jgi:NADH-quinone oxidoreductase subunit A
MLNPYVPVLVTFAIAGAIVTAMLLLAQLLAPRVSTPVKAEAFECGNPPSGSAWGRFSVKFYMTAILFIIFDVEVVLLFPYAVLFRQLGWYGFANMMIFIVILAIALLYAWRKGGLEWD